MTESLLRQALAALESLESYEAPEGKIPDAIEAIRSHLEGGMVPADSVVVPRKATEAMLTAGARSIIDGVEKRGNTAWAIEASMAYKAMLAAAPKVKSRVGGNGR